MALTLRVNVRSTSPLARLKMRLIMPATQTASHPAGGNPPTFESVWAILQEVAASQKETDRQLKETDRIIKEVGRKQEETDRIVKETSKQIGTINNRFGEIVEYMVAPNLKEKFREYGFRFHDVMTDRVFSDDDDNTLFEVDVLLQNSEKAMLVETKATLTTEDVRDHVERLKKMRKYADLHGDKRIFLGAVAGVVMTLNVKRYALKQGFYVIEPSGESFNIISPSGKPKEW